MPGYDHLYGSTQTSGGTGTTGGFAGSGIMSGSSSSSSSSASNTNNNNNNNNNNNFQEPLPTEPEPTGFDIPGLLGQIIPKPFQEKKKKKVVRGNRRKRLLERKEKLLSILNNPNTTQNQKNQIIKNKNLTATFNNLRKQTQTAPVGLGIPPGGKNLIRDFAVPVKKDVGFFDWGGKGLTFLSPQHQQMDKDARIEINKAFALPPSLGFKPKDFDTWKLPRVDAMRHLIWTAVNPTLAVAHDIGQGDTQDLHNNSLRGIVLDRASKMEGGKTYDNIKEVAKNMVLEQERIVQAGFPPRADLPITDAYGQYGEQADELYPDGKPSWTKALEPLTSGHSLITKADTPLNNIVNSVSNFFMSFSLAQANEGE